MVRVELDRSAALVLFEFLARFDESDQLRIDDPAEEYALWSLHGCLERLLVEPLQADYKSLVEKARADLRAHWGGDSAG